MTDSWPQIVESLAARDLDRAKELIWPRDAGEEWYYSMPILLENAAGGYEKTDKDLAIFCYEQARDLYRAQATGATSGGEGMAMMNEDRDRQIGRKIWLLRDRAS